MAAPLTPLAVVASLVLTLVTSAPANAHAKIECSPAAFGQVADPIVNQGQSASHHNHSFFGSTTGNGQTAAEVNAFDYSDVVGTATTCENGDDSALYWVPTVYTDGKPLPVKRVLAYYRGTNGLDQDTTTRAFPIDARLVSRVTNWTCGALSSSRPGPYSSPQEAACHTATGKVNLTAHVDFPNCWDGRLNSHTGPGNTADFSDIHTGIVNHFTFAGGKKFKKRAECPSTHPIRLPSLRLAVAFGDNNPGTLKGVLSSSHAGTDFSGYHGDFWNTWRQTGGAHGGLTGMVDRCINYAAADHHKSTNVAVCGN